MKTKRLPPGKQLNFFALLVVSFGLLWGEGSWAIARANPSVIVNPSLSETPYTIGKGDRLRIDIFDVPEYSNEYQVLIDGTIDLPVIGTLLVEGLTLPQLREFIAREYAPFVQRPIVTVNLIAARPLKIAISGEIKRPGSYTITLSEGQQFPTITEVIERAGGLTGIADLRQIQLQRQLQGQSRVIIVNLWELFQQGNLARDLTLRDGDIIFIPTARDIDIAEARQLAEASFAPETTEPIKIAVVGEVSRPGAYTLIPEQVRFDNNRASSSLPTVTQALEEAGGITQQADIRRIQVRRTTRTGEERVIDINLWEMLQAGDLKQDLILHQGDTIAIPTARRIASQEIPALAAASFSPDTIKINVVGEVPNPGIVELPPNTPLNQALLAAGGFEKRRARQGSVELIRLNLNGTVSQREISVDFAAGISNRQNPALRNNDTIVVRRSTLAGVADAIGTITSPLSGILSVVNFLRILQ